VKGSSRRPEQVAETVRQVIADALTRGDVRDPRVGFVTLTGVLVTNDLSHARVMVSLPGAEAERTRAVMGADFWTYGLAGNEDTLRTFVRYAFEQGLISREREPAELFAPETREAYVI